MTAYLVIAFVLTMDLVVGFFGAVFGYTVQGSIQSGTAGWNWYDMFTFVFDLSAFRVDNMPYIISAVFLIFNLMLIVVIVRTIRGND